MRVTEVSKREQVLENIQKTSARLQDAQIQMATGQRINTVSYTHLTLPTMAIV